MTNPVEAEYSEFKKYFYASVILAILALIGALIAIGSTGQSSQITTFQNEITSADGSFEQRTQFGGAKSIVSGSGAYSYTLTAKMTDGTVLNFDESIEMTVVTEVRGRPVSNRYEVGIYNDATGYKHKLVARKVDGPFTGKADFISTETSIDSLIFMEGDATYKGVVVNQSTGKHPQSESETYAIGYNTIRQYLNSTTTDKIKNQQGWLNWCNEWNGLTPVAREGMWILPDGYYYDGMSLKPIPEGYFLSDSGRILPLEEIPDPLPPEEEETPESENSPDE